MAQATQVEAITLSNFQKIHTLSKLIVWSSIYG